MISMIRASEFLEVAWSDGNFAILHRIRHADIDAEYSLSDDFGAEELIDFREFLEECQIEQMQATNYAVGDSGDDAFGGTRSEIGVIRGGREASGTMRRRDWPMPRSTMFACGRKDSPGSS